MADEEINKLPPEERFAKLKELEEKRKKELEETEKLIKQSVAEIQDKQETKRKIPIEQVKALDMESLQTQEEKDMFKTQRYVSEKKEESEEEPKEKQETEQEIPWPRSPDEISLEEKVDKENIPEDAKKNQGQYNMPGTDIPNLYKLAQEASQNDTLDKIKGLEGRSYNDWSTDERSFAERMNYIADTGKDKIRDHYHDTIAEETLARVDGVKEEMERLRGDYIK